MSDTRYRIRSECAHQLLDARWSSAMKPLAMPGEGGQATAQHITRSHVRIQAGTTHRNVRRHGEHRRCAINRVPEEGAAMSRIRSVCHRCDLRDTHFAAGRRNNAGARWIALRHCFSRLVFRTRRAGISGCRCAADTACTPRATSAGHAGNPASPGSRGCAPSAGLPHPRCLRRPPSPPAACPWR